MTPTDHLLYDAFCNKASLYDLATFLIRATPRPRLCICEPRVRKRVSMAVDYVIFGIVAVAVFIYLGYALPNRALYGSQNLESKDLDRAPRGLPPSTRLSRCGALAISLGLVALFATSLTLAPRLDPVVALAIVAISLWATVDSHRVRLWSYKTRIALHPIALFNAMIFLWPVLFPWYLTVCSRIGDGTLARKSDRPNCKDRR